MELLSAINLTLPALGEHVVTRVDARHPTLAVILPVLELKIKECLMRGWWFNEGQYTLYPDTNGEIVLPTNTLSFLPTGDVKATVRKFKLYNQAARNFVWPGPVDGTLLENLDFEELPESVATYVYYSALVQVYITDIGLEQVVQKWEGYAQTSEFTATQEHLRNMKYSTRKSSRYAHWRSALRG